jgi:amino acid transporter
MESQGHGRFKKQISLIDMILVGIGAIIGSGWLFASGLVASIAGPAGWISWVIGGIALLLLGLVYAELGAAFPRAGGLVRYPLYSHGPLVGFLMSFITVIAFSSICSIEAEAARQYATSWWPALSQPGSTTSPTVLGWLVQLGLLGAAFLLNYWSIGVFAKTNSIITLFKYITPTVVIIVLLTQLKPANFSVHGFAPFGISGITAAITTGGIMFAYLGLQPIMGLAGEVKNPQRNVPIALIAATVLSAIVYVLLQVAFIGGIPTDKLSGSWASVANEFSLPYRDIAVALGIGWLAILVTADAVVSPSGTGNIFMSTTSRVVFGWARNRTLFGVFRRIHGRTGIPRPALWLTLGLSIFWTLPFPSWGVLVAVVSSALIFTYAVAPISAYALRRNAPDLPRPFYLKGISVIGPISFIIASLILYWAGWHTLSWLLALQLLMFVIYLLARRWVPTDQVSLAQQVKSSWWLVSYYVVILVLSYLGSFDGINLIKSPWDQVLVALASVGIYYWGGRSGLAQPIVDEDEVEEEEKAEAVPAR